jgi:protein-L-isoaspartate(D-aspartate) O-methyltransferase
MVTASIEARGISEPCVLKAMREVPRHLFVPAEVADFAYADSPLPIGEEQTISQPYVVALMTQALRLSPEDRVLEVGTGSGYGAAVLSRVGREVYSIERHPSLAGQATETLARLGYANVHVLCGDGALGLPSFAPYDAISVTAAARSVPEAHLWQLAPGGRLVIPVGGKSDQELLRITRLADGGFAREDLGGVRFVPLIVGAGGAQSQ